MLCNAKDPSSRYVYILSQIRKGKKGVQQVTLVKWVQFQVHGFEGFLGCLIPTGLPVLVGLRSAMPPDPVHANNMLGLAA